ncbi:MAG: ABC transporter substrate-binding protein [bacterium]|nr:ABC transporter substrate-binding protein [bacterium]
MKHLLRSPVLFAALMAVMAAPCVSGAEEVVVGVILPLSGAQAALGHMQKNSMTLAVEGVNRRGGIDGQDLKLDIRDSGGRVSDIRAIIDHFVNDKAYPLVLGGGSSKVIDAMAERCQYRNLPLVSITGSNDGITRKGYSYLFRVAPPRSEYPAAALEYAAAVIDPKKVALWHEPSDFGSSMADAVRESVREKGWELVWEGSFEPGTMNLEESFKALETLKPDAVFLCAFPPDDTRIVTGLTGRLKSKYGPFNLVPASSLGGSLAACGEGCAGVLAPSLWLSSSGPASQRYNNDYVERFGTLPDYHGAQAYAAVLVAVQALRHGGGLETEALKETLGAMGISTPYGYVTFPDRGGHTNQNNPPNYLVRWNGEGFEKVWPKGQ